jgi:hypothetical protein
MKESVALAGFPAPASGRRALREPRSRWSPAGHRFRISISTSYWPLAWTSPEPLRIKLFNKSSTVHIPVREPRAGDLSLAPFGEPCGAPPIRKRVDAGPHRNWDEKIPRDLV